MSNHRLALLDITGEALPEAVSVILDHDIEISGSEASPEYGAVRLVLREWAGKERFWLPDECAVAICRVKISVKTETLGRQKITRIDKIEVV